jgi:hypothetical protein
MRDVLPLVPSSEWIPANAITSILGHGASQVLGDLYAKRLIDRRPVGRDKANLFEYRRAS